VAEVRDLRARDMPLAMGFALLSVIIRPFLLDDSQVVQGDHPKTTGTGHGCTKLAFTQVG